MRELRGCSMQARVSSAELVPQAPRVRGDEDCPCIPRKMRAPFNVCLIILPIYYVQYNQKVRAWDVPEDPEERPEA